LTPRKFKPTDTVDFVIVGSGAAGGVLARELSQAGFSVVVLEQGPRFSAADFEHDEFKYTYLSGITNDPASSPQTFRDDPAQTAARPHMGNSLIYARMVGGSSNHFTANYWRFHENDFNERSLLGAIPGTGFADWPISYQELEPYYTKVEWEVGVSGLGEASPFDPPRTKPYPMPPLPVKSSGALFEQGARKVGLHPFPAPMAIVSQPYRGRPGCAHCGFCIGFGCEVMAKSSALYTMIPEAEATGRCEIRPHSYVFQVSMNPAGRQARAIPEGARGRTRGERRGDRAAAAEFLEQPLSAGARQFERPGRQVPDVQSRLGRACSIRARTQRIQERAGDAHPARFLRRRFAARFLRRRRHRRPHGIAARRLGAVARR
jgi:choline dehydrogenase-like flavoprotein